MKPEKAKFYYVVLLENLLLECNRQQQQVIVGKGEITPTQRIVYKTNCSPRCILLHFN